MDCVEYTYNRKFEGKVLIVSQTGCGKTTFVQNLEKTIFLVNLKTFFGYRKFPFHQREKVTLGAVLKNM